MALNEKQQLLIKAYQRYVQAGQRYMAGLTGFRKRVREDALAAELQNMQAALKDIIRLGQGISFNEHSRELSLWLPAEGRIGQTQIVDAPYYKILQLPPGSGKKVAAFFRGESRYEAIRNFDDCLVLHKIILDDALQGPAPLFGSLIRDPHSKETILLDYSL